ncbi:hypothetical protein EV714DRAFT_278430 [Schizophyllum commune]
MSGGCAGEATAPQTPMMQKCGRWLSPTGNLSVIIPVIDLVSATVPMLAMNLASTVLIGVQLYRVGRALMILFGSGVLYYALQGVLSTFIVLAIMPQERLEATKSTGSPSGLLASIRWCTAERGQ